MRSDCAGCGAPLNAPPSAVSILCDYCGSRNTDEQFIEQRLRTLDQGRVQNLFAVGLARFKASDFAGAADLFERALVEDASNSDLWVYLAVSLAQSLDLSNVGQLIDRVDAALERASELTPDSDVYWSGAAACQQAIATTLLRAALRHKQEGDKAYFAFESIDRGQAKARRCAEYCEALDYASFAVGLPIEDLRVRSEIVKLVFALAAADGVGPTAAGEARAGARTALEEIRRVNCTLADAVDLEIQKTQRPTKPNFFRRLFR